MLMRMLLSTGLLLTCPLAENAWQDGGWVSMNTIDAPLTGVVAGEGVILVAGDGYFGVQRSLDSGRTWHPFRAGLTSDPQLFPGFRIHFDPEVRLFYCATNRNIHVAAPAAAAWTPQSGIGAFPSLSVDGPTLIVQDSTIRVSRDGGRTWRQAAESFFQGTNGVLAVDSCVHVAKADGPIATSCDGGTTWMTSRNDTLSIGAIGMVRHQSAVIAAAGGRLIRTLDRGRTWHPWPGNLTGIDQVYQLDQANGILYAWKHAGQPATSVDSLHRSLDGGQTWSPVFTPQSAAGPPYLPTQVTHLGNSLFGATLVGLVTSPDAGKTWLPAPMGSIRKPILSLGIHGSRYLAYTEGGVFTSGDSGATWVHALDTDAAKTWTGFGGSGSRFAAGNQQGGIRVTLDAGGSWSDESPLPRPARILSATAWNGSFFAGTEDALWRRNETAGPWTEVSMPAAGPFRLLAAGRQSLLIGSNAHIWELREDGSLEDRSAGIKPSLLTHLWMVDDRPFAGNSTAGYLHRWNASGAVWQTLPVPLPFRCFAGTGNTLVTSSGKVSEDGGKTWSLLNQLAGRITPPGFISLTFTEGHFYGGDGKGGVWKYSTSLAGPLAGGAPSRARRGQFKTPDDVRNWLREGEARIDGRRFRHGRIKW